MITLYGIPNCDTVKKARRFLDEHGVAYTFHDFKKSGVTQALLMPWIKSVGIDILLNKRGLTWRRLPAEDKENVTDAKALKLMLQNASIIKRPVLIDGDTILVGFDEEAYAALAKVT